MRLERKMVNRMTKLDVKERCEDRVEGESNHKYREKERSICVVEK